MIPGFCRDCLADAPATSSPASGARCAVCRSPRLIRHPEIDGLTIAHIDCDAFYATVEKRDNPEIADKPVIIGGGKRGVVSAACYISRTYGVRSAMPMFEAMRLCPNAVVIRPDMAKYVAVGRQVRDAMRALTPLVEPLSIDEAFLDLSGTQRLHGASAAKTLAKLAIAVERDIGITVSIGLSGNKFLAKIASDLDKPRGFAVLGVAEAPAFLAPRPVSFIYGVGKAMETRLQNDGYRLIADLQRADEIDLMRRYGAEGRRLARLAHGTDVRVVDPSRETKSVSAETTFNKDIADYTALERILWSLSEKVSRRLKKQELAGVTINVKLKTSDFRTRTRAASLSDATQLAARIFDTGRELLKRETDGTSFRLIGIGVSALVPADEADPANLMDRRSVDAEHAVDRLRAKFGDAAIVRGLAFDKGEDG